MTFIDLVRRVAKDHGRFVTDEEAEFILWEHTGYPAFWPGTTRDGRVSPLVECAVQIDRFFAEDAHAS